MNWKALIASLVLFVAAFGIGERLSAAPVTKDIRFRVGRSAVDSSYRTNDATLAWAREQLSREGLKSITICASASPEGSTSLNTRLARQRAEALVSALKEIQPDLDESLIYIEVKGEDWKGLERLVSRSKEPWRDEALELIRSGGDKREELLSELYVGEAWDNISRQYFPALRKASVCFNFETEVSKPKENRILFPVGKVSLSTDYANNGPLLEKLKEQLRDSGDTLYIKGFSSPEGSEAANLSLSEKRADAVRKYLVSEGFPDSWMVIQKAGEDWTSLTEAVRESGDYPEVLRILENNSLRIAQKKARIRSLDAGATWREIIARFGGGLRAVEVTFAGNHTEQNQPHSAL